MVGRTAGSARLWMPSNAWRDQSHSEKNERPAIFGGLFRTAAYRTGPLSTDSAQAVVRRHHISSTRPPALADRRSPVHLETFGRTLRRGRRPAPNSVGVGDPRRTVSETRTETLCPPTS